MTWLQNTLKLRTPSSRACSSVTRGRRRGRLEPDGEEHDLAVGVLDGDAQRVERRVDEADVGAARLGLEQVAVAAGHAHHVAEGREDHARRLGHGDGVVDPAHRDHAHRAARARAPARRLGQHVLDAVAVDGVGVAAAHLHELEAVAAGELGDARDERRGRPPGRGTRRRTSSAAPPRRRRRARRRASGAARARRRTPPIICRPSRRELASSSSIFDMAKPTWISTQSPTPMPSSSSRPMLIDPRTPVTSTRARCSSPSRNSTIWPGIPRHMGRYICRILR